MNSRHSEIQELLEKLDPIERESVILRIWGDFGFEELAGILGVSTSKAYRIYQSALSQLRRSIDSDLQLLTGSKPSEK
jgi:DNA-directed RNA polymerase specialized sigma24 family protein